MADVQGVDAPSAPLEQAVGEAAGGGAHVQDHGAGWGELEGVQGMGQLDPAPAHVGKPAGQLDDSGGRVPIRLFH